jgi:hypothetical protein
MRTLMERKGVISKKKKKHEILGKGKEWYHELKNNKNFDGKGRNDIMN